MIETTATVQPGLTMLGCLKRQWFMALLTAIFVFCALSSVVFNLTPLYAAKTTLIVPYTPVSELANRNEAVSSPQSDPLIVHSYIQILKDDGLCLQVIRQLHLQDRHEFNAAPTFPARLLAPGFLVRTGVASAQLTEDRVLRRYKKKLKIDGGRSLAVDLTFQSESADLAAAIVNAHAEAYQAAQIQFRRHETEVKASWMQEQVSKSAADLRAAQVAVQLHQGSPRFGLTSATAANESAELKFLQSVLTSKQSIYESLLQRQQIMLAEQHYGGSDTRILSLARSTIQPAFPNIPIFEALAACVSGLVGVGLAWGSEMLAHRRFGTAGRLSALGITQLARVEIPRRWRFLPRRFQKLRLAVFWEQIREVRSSLPALQKKSRVLAVTSAAPKQSTSLVAASLARAYAASGASTLLLDLNFRHPSAHSFFAESAKLRSGLQGCSIAALNLDRAVRPVADCLWLLPLASERGESVDVLAGPATRTMLNNLRKKYSTIVIDTPPLGIVCDALVIADLADEVVMVANDDALDLEALARAARSLRARTAAVRGVVLTSHRPTNVDAYRQLGGFARDNKLSEEWPWPCGSRKARDAGDFPNPGLLQAAE